MFSKRMSFSALCVALLTVCAMFPSERSQSAPGLTEVELKAVFLLRLPQFVSLPAGSIDEGAIRPVPLEISSYRTRCNWALAPGASRSS